MGIEWGQSGGKDVLPLKATSFAIRDTVFDYERGFISNSCIEIEAANIQILKYLCISNSIV